jgi:hypothetical protein
MNPKAFQQWNKQQWACLLTVKWTPDTRPPTIRVSTVICTHTLLCLCASSRLCLLNTAANLPAYTIRRNNLTATPVLSCTIAGILCQALPTVFLWAGGSKPNPLKRTDTIGLNPMRARASVQGPKKGRRHHQYSPHASTSSGCAEAMQSLCVLL